MTHFKVSDEAVRVAGEAVEKATAQLEMVQCVAYDREVSEAIARIAIEAALPVMFEEVAAIRTADLMFLPTHGQCQCVLFAPSKGEGKTRTILLRLKESK